MEPHRHRTHWRDNIEAITMAVVMALLLKHFIVEAYKIPTGSMQPTLIGDEESGIKDRILVDKLSYVFRDPERWDVAVFRYPLDRAQNFVKRIVGVGPEELTIRYGDLWRRDIGTDEWHVLRRPRRVQDAEWKRLDAEHPPETSWRLLDPRADWTLEGRSIRARGDGRASFLREGSIVDLYLDGYPEAVVPYVTGEHSRSGANPVGDLRVDGSITSLPGTDAVVVELREGERTYDFRIPGPAADENAHAEIQEERIGSWNPPHGEAVLGEPYRLPAGARVSFRVQNMDDLLQLEVDGRELCRREVEPTADQRSAVFLDVAGEGVDFDDLMVYRDIYYLAEGNSEVTIPAGQYYMLGDNTQDSSDSREWRFRRYSLPADDGAPRILRGNSRGSENPRTVGFGDPDGPKLVFEDEWGETHWFRSGALDQLPPEPAPFVPRDLVLGKALAVFWPLDPLKGIYRIKWVN